MGNTEGRKKLNYKLLERKDFSETYALMDKLIGAHHTEIADAKIALAWRFGFKEDKDGHIVLGKCKKCSDLDREAHDFDFIIILNYEFWNDGQTTDAQRAALLDHELCHASVSTDAQGEEKMDVHGRYVYRVRKHDVEEFREIVDRHGIWKQDLQQFAESIRAAKKQPLLHPAVKKEAKERNA